MSAPICMSPTSVRSANRVIELCALGIDFSRFVRSQITGQFNCSLLNHQLDISDGAGLNLGWWRSTSGFSILVSCRFHCSPHFCFLCKLTESTKLDASTNKVHYRII
jgi:hypothetical protein